MKGVAVNFAMERLAAVARRRTGFSIESADQPIPRVDDSGDRGRAAGDLGAPVNRRRRPQKFSAPAIDLLLDVRLSFRAPGPGSSIGPQTGAGCVLHQRRRFQIFRQRCRRHRRQRDWRHSPCRWRRPGYDRNSPTVTRPDPLAIAIDRLIVIEQQRRIVRARTGPCGA